MDSFELYIYSKAKLHTHEILSNSISSQKPNLINTTFLERYWKKTKKKKNMQNQLQLQYKFPTGNNFEHLCDNTLKFKNQHLKSI